MLTTTSEYAIRALVYLSLVPEGEPLLGRDLAIAANVPSNYLAKILITLNHSGMLEATRGRGGGYRLSRPADEITLIEVVTALEGEAAIPQCILEHNRMCTDENPCTAHGHWRKVRNAYIDFLEKTTIASIAQGADGATLDGLKSRAEEVAAARPL